MSKTRQKLLIKSICNNNRDYMLQKVSDNKVPDDWDGFEFRHWLEQIAHFENYWNSKDYKRTYKKRIKECNNTILINNL